MLQHPTHPPAHIIQPQQSTQATYTQESSNAPASSSTPASPRDGAESPTAPATTASTVTSKATRGRKRKPTPAQDAELSAQGLAQPTSQPPPPQQQPTPPPQTSLPHPHPHPHLHPPQFAFATGPDGSVQPYPLHPMQVPVGAMLVNGPPPQAPSNQHQEDQYSSSGSPSSNQPATHNGRVLSATKRAEQNRKAQRAFRERRDAHVKALESRSQLLDAALASVEEANRRWEEARQMVESLRLENSQLRAALGAFQQAAQQVQAQARSTQPQPHESSTSAPANGEQESGSNAMDTEERNQENAQREEAAQA